MLAPSGSRRPYTSSNLRTGTQTTRRHMMLGAGLAIAGVLGSSPLAACTAPGSAAQPPQPSKLSGTLHYMDWELGTAAAQERWKKVLERFHDKYPNITVEEDRTNLFDEKLPAVVAAGTPPDTANLRRQAEFPALVGKNTVQPIDAYLAKSTILKRADFYDKTLAMNSWQGKLYALPTSAGLYVLYYNKNLFQERGLKLPDLTWSYDDFDDAAVKLTKHAGSDFQQAGVQMPSWWIIHYLGNHDVGIWQGGLLDKSTCSRVNYDKPEVAAGYEWYQKHLCQLKTMEPEPFERQRTGFEQGTAAMRLSYIQINTFHDKIGDQFAWDVTLAPLGDKKKPRVQTIIGSGAAIFNESKSPDLAWAWIEFMNDPQSLLEQIRLEGASNVWPNKKVMESKEYQSSKLPPADKSVFIKGLEAAKFFPEASWEMRAMGIQPPDTSLGKIFDCTAAPREVLGPAANAINGTLKQAGVGCP